MCKCARSVSSEDEKDQMSTLMKRDEMYFKDGGPAASWTLTLMLTLCLHMAESRAEHLLR